MKLPDFVTIGAHSYSADLALHRWGNETISIGKWCSLSQNVKLLAGGGHNHQHVTTYPMDVLLRGMTTASAEDRCYEHGDGIRIENDVHVGFGATIIGNVRVGNGAVIAANATVFTDVPDYGIAVGNPARVNKFRFDETTIAELLKIAWWNWPEAAIKSRLDFGAFYWPVEEFVRQYRNLTRADNGVEVFA